MSITNMFIVGVICILGAAVASYFPNAAYIVGFVTGFVVSKIPAKNTF